ncbi:DUF6602 domain-containing protein [Accumulibacter sp.]|nr:DUF6602 domain-containing protein [Accumulibacter sp.]MCM8594662.1 hypothetical protein [Accumulibacter sp.]MDS4048808.1 hypothetical protein [Accumulibacter sp.]
MPDRLTEILDGLQARLEGGLRGNRSAVTHPGARGEASEEDWLRILNDHLPQRYQANRAFVIDSQGECSEQIDIVIYDRQYSPLLYNQANQRYVPAESVYGVLEVKQALSREHVLYAGQKAASVQRLHRTSAPVPHVEGVAKPRPVPRIVAGIVTYQSSWTPPFGEPLRDSLAGLGADHQLDVGCSLLHGTFEVRYPSPGTVHLAAVEGPRSPVQFLLRLLKQLQSLATAPAIDYEAYLARFQADGGVTR